MRVKRLIAGALVITAAGFGWTMNTEGTENRTHELVADFGRGETPAVGYTDAIAQAVALLENNPSYVIVIEGHSGTRGPDSATMAMSERRAARVLDDLEDAGIELPRTRVFAKGESEPLPQFDGEADNAYQARLNRVELYIIHENIDPESVL